MVYNGLRDFTYALRGCAELHKKKCRPMLHDRIQGGLRQHVRAALAHDHDRVDAKFAELDLQQHPDFVIFLQAHRAAFDAMRNSRSGFQGRIKRAHIDDLINALETDLNSLRVPILRITTDTRVYSDLAVDHIVLGSRLGTAVLRSKWLMSQDRRVRQARNYFAQPQLKDEWRAHCMHLSSMDASDALGLRLIDDARGMFALFESALDVCR